MPDLDGSSFFITVFGALAGAFAGAWAAQRSARNGKRRDELVAEIRVINAGLILSHSIFESTLSAKKDYIDPTKVRYEIEKSRYLKQLEMLSESCEMVVNFELQYFPEFSSQVGQLQPLVLQQGSTPALRAITALVEASGLMSEALKLRNDCLRKFERREIPPNFTYQDLYFGLAAKDGRDQQFSNAVIAVSLYTDNVIYFSRRLCDHLSERGEGLRKELKRISRERVSIVEFNFDTVDASGLFPARDNYKLWESSYEEVRSRPLWNWWRR
ncbi:hypothetical protein [Achromobacter sp. AGC25]